MKRFCTDMILISGGLYFLEILDCNMTCVCYWTLTFRFSWFKPHESKSRGCFCHSHLCVHEVCVSPVELIYIGVCSVYGMDRSSQYVCVCRCAHFLYPISQWVSCQKSNELLCSSVIVSCEDFLPLMTQILHCIGFVLDSLTHFSDAFSVFSHSHKLLVTSIFCNWWILRLPLAKAQNSNFTVYNNGKSNIIRYEMK